MRFTCNVVLPKDRTMLGTFTVVDVDGNRIVGPFPCLGLSDHGAAAMQGNPTADPLKPFGDTPLGLFAATLIPPAGPAPSDVHSYGPYRRLALTPISGPCASMDRDGIEAHGGGLDPLRTKTQGLRCTHGCLRLKDADILPVLIKLTGAEEILVNVTEADGIPS